MSAGQKQTLRIPARDFLEWLSGRLGHEQPNGSVYRFPAAEASALVYEGESASANGQTSVPAAESPLITA